ncbi:hypothetical protein AWZ03_015407, partial [Drosophila navojoa]
MDKFVSKPIKRKHDDYLDKILTYKFDNMMIDDTDDPDIGDNELEDDDDDYEEYVQDNDSEPARKRRRISTRDSCSLPESDAFIYLDLSRPVAIVTSEPTTDEAVESDSELKIRLQKFLGLVPRRRRLYNPMANFEYEDNHMDDPSSNASVQPQSTPTVPDKRN